jgi:hypothetical protein
VASTFTRCKTAWLTESETTRELKLAVVTRLRGGWSHRQILATLPVKARLVHLLSKQIGARYYKRHGRGRSIRPELKEQILEGLRGGKTSAELQRRFSVDDRTIRQYRRELGDFSNRRKILKLTPEQIARAEQMLRDNEKWIVVAKSFGVALHTLQKRVKYRKRG